MQRVAVIGASPKRDRYAWQAAKLLKDFGHEVLLVSPVYQEIDGEKTYPNLKSCPQPIDTVTLYIGPDKQTETISQIIELNPRRVIFNPGTENKEARQQLDQAGIAYEEACTLVLLRTGQFELMN